MTSKGKLELYKREAAKRSFEHYTTFIDELKHREDKKYQVKIYHRMVMEKLEDVASGKIRKLMISVPPQHGKSTLSSVNFPSWMLGKDETIKVAVASYSSLLSEWFSRKTRDIIRWDYYNKVFDTKIKIDSQSVQERQVEWWWSYTAVWVGWSLTGKPVDLMIIDDTHKDRAEAESKLMRDKCWDWYTSVVLSRLHKDSKQVVIMTRRHEDDLCWKILEHDDDREVINIPVFNVDWSTIRPERFPVEFIEEKRKVSWERDFQALYMWNPLDLEGWSFTRDMFRTYDITKIRDNTWNINNNIKIVSFIDPAISTKQTADYTAIVTIGIDVRNNDIYILDIYHAQVEPDDIIDNLFRIVWQYNPCRVGIEVVQYQKMLALEIQKQMRIRNMFFVLDEVRPMWEKEARIKSVLQARYSNKTVYHSLICNELEYELLKFPSGKNDDIIDALSWAVRLLESVNIGKKLVKEQKPVVYNPRTNKPIIDSVKARFSY